MIHRQHAVESSYTCEECAESFGSKEELYDLLIILVLTLVVVVMSDQIQRSHGLYSAGNSEDC
jgi:hypothetical protein